MPAPKTTGGEVLRADARRNRTLIIEAARQLLISGGPAVPMEEIARHAGVGVGTLYRRFPDRDTLIQAIALASFDRVMDSARTAEAEPTGWGTLHRFLGKSADDLRTAALLAAWFPQAWQVTRADPRDQRSRSELLRFLERLVRRCQAEGSVRPDVGVGDLVLLLTLLLRPPPGRLAELTDRAPTRALAIALAGLRAESAEPTAPAEALPGRRVTLADLRRSGSVGEVV